MNISFYFDPSCPFCWITSRWLLTIAEHREIYIDWQPFSLALKNDELNSTNENDSTPHGDMHRASHRVLRVIQAANADSDATLINLYTSFGKAFHVDKRDFDDALIAEILSAHNLQTDLIEKATDSSLDNSLQAVIESAIDVAGEDIGVPTIIFEQADGNRAGYFGPVLQTLPDLDESLAIWDGLSKLANVSSFYELKRARPDGWPDVMSTISLSEG